MTDEERNPEEPAETEDAEGAKGGNDQAVDEDSGEKGLGSESGAAGGGNSPEHNPDPSTKGSVQGSDKQA